ncbi:S-DNA-T family DNA segregation ATPase FtsK/SpoIIIE [Ureibacillus xyleni]|uniref:S-DNA-T family DNA segregation ATPase FtsK/SpoIIIE n=1 Tax=Ureibacillus xyleni TaxID=614648 RepID=A0A285SWG4_9BACL|nr:FtsK/SpoIIIE domain-containing protein [Ureibacillus xyleni]SOC12951.1 S-DNA-T family DNA segregation ATPase FtsK/SpoIIIE [Ureibacillus xyleni]
MLFEILTTSIFGGIAATAFIKKQGIATNDSGKIQRIMSLSGLNVKDGKDTLSTQLITKKQYEWGWEYKYRIPLGRSFKDYLTKLDVLEDGINNRRKRIRFSDLKSLDWDGNIILQLKELWRKKLTESKEIELDYNGLLIIRVYDKPLPSKVLFIKGENWEVPVGITRKYNTFKFHDFEKIPHLALGGATRYGKSNFINSIIISLLNSKPNYVNLFLIDLKGGVELCDYENIKQTVSIAYEPQEALETLKLAYDKMRSIQMKLKKLGKKNVQEAGIEERYFVIIDEVGELNPSESVKAEKDIKYECQKYMSQIARLGAGLGFRLVVATQYPTGDVIPRQVKQNSDAKLCFRVQSGVASRVVLDSEGAEMLPEIKGRAILQSADKREIVQTPLVTSGMIKESIAPFVIKKGVQIDDYKEEINEQGRTDFATFREV